MSTALPDEAQSVTTYSSVIIQSRFHLFTNSIYTRVISMQCPSADELIRLDDTMIRSWITSIPPWYAEDAPIPPKFALGHGIMWWRLRSFRIIMYRPYVIRRALQPHAPGQPNLETPEVEEASDRCLREAKVSIHAISQFWSLKQHTRMGAWYALHFLFQASLIPCLCICKDPSSPQAGECKEQVQTAQSVTGNMYEINSSSHECYEMIERLCGHLIRGPDNPDSRPEEVNSNLSESLHDQIGDVYSMMWPGARTSNTDVLMQDGAWTNFLGDDFYSAG